MRRAPSERPIWRDAHRDARFTWGRRSSVEQATRVAVVASWGDGPTVSRSLVALIDELARCGYQVVVSRASDDHAPLQWNRPLPAGTIVIQRSNRGYDFGSWACALALLPGIWSAERVLLVNDSMIGPFASLEGVLQDFEQSSYDAWSLTSANQYFPHLQSYLLGFPGSTMQTPAIRWFWRNVRHERGKLDFIRKYELGLSRLLHSEAMTFRAAYSAETLGRPGVNPSIAEWRRLLDLGVPMVKRELVTSPGVVPDAFEVPHEIRTRFGEAVEDWV